MFEFSIPMPLHAIGISFISRLNKNLKKSKITSIYFALPSSDENYTGFEQNRTEFKHKTNFDYWSPILKQAQQENLEIIYLLNSPKPIDNSDNSLQLQLEKLDRLILFLKEHGCHSLRVSNIQLLNYLTKNHPEMNYYASTSFEWLEKKQYKQFIDTFPEIKQIVPSFNLNKNFKLLKNLKASFPNVDIELMLNEGCIAGCPFRNEHNASLHSHSNNKIQNKDFSMNLYTEKCNAIGNKNIYEYICTSNIIHPWELEKYENIGITKFKLVGRNSMLFFNGKYLEIYKNYLLGVDDYKNIKNLDYKYFNHYIAESEFPIKIKDIRPYLPKIEHFIKNGHLCSSICESECNYCFECAKKMKNALESK